MRKVIWFCILLAVVCSQFVPVAGAISSISVTASSRTAERMLKGGGFYGRRHRGGANLDDYAPVDPSPSSKAVKPGPIVHGTHLIPYIPRLSPPNNPRIDTYP